MRSESERRIFNRFADLLEYPRLAPVSTARGAAEALAASQTSAAEALTRFADAAEGLDLRRLQEVYTSNFDLQPTCCLYVGYHLFGDSYKRSAMLAKLSEEYSHHGFSAGAELQDHLAVMLRFVASTGDGELSRDLTQECLLPALGAMVRAFGDSPNPYGHAIRALLAFLDPTGKVGVGELAGSPVGSRLPVLEDRGADDGPPCAAWR